MDPSRNDGILADVRENGVVRPICRAKRCGDDVVEPWL